MKHIWTFWNKRSSYEKSVLGLFAVFALFCLGYFIVSMCFGSKCAVCEGMLIPGKHYILDVRTGEILGIAEYVDRERSVFWLSPISHAPQDVSVMARLGYMRFPLQAPRTARYCRDHTSNLDSDFLVLSPDKSFTVFYAIRDGQTLDPDGRIITKRLNKALNCWELEIQWESKTPVSSP